MNRARVTDASYVAIIYRYHATLFRDSAARLHVTFDTPASESLRSRFAIPYYFLVSQAMELFLKSALLKTGADDSELRKRAMRHNLGALLAQLEVKGLTVSGQTAMVVRALSEQHENHALRYSALIEGGTTTYMPPPAVVESVLDELLMLTRISTQGDRVF